MIGELQGYGIAFDIGTTTVVGMLWDLSQANLLATISKTNPQRSFGTDVISRISYSGKEKDNLIKLQKLINSCMNEIIGDLCDCSNINRDSINKITVVGNTTMSHLFLGMDPTSLALAPFAPAFTGPVEKTALDLNLYVNQGARILLLPNIAGHVGSDITGVLLATKAKEGRGLRLIIDIGTNGELALAYNGRIVVCSTAAGPAFEGAALHKGMKASKGAIDKVRIHEDQIELGIIGGVSPLGICGSGVVDLLAQMLQTGIIDDKGKLLDESDEDYYLLHPALRERLRKGEKGREFVLETNTSNGDIVITQKDIREIQMAKAAIYSGILLILKHFNQSISSIDEILLAGAFGNYINTKSAVEIGLLPPIIQEHIKPIGNAAARGASMALLSEEELEKAQSYMDVEHIELALQSNFQEEYLKAMYFRLKATG